MVTQEWERLVSAKEPQQTFISFPLGLLEPLSLSLAEGEVDD